MCRPLLPYRCGRLYPLVSERLPGTGTGTGGRSAGGGRPKGSTWKHPFVLDMDVLKTIPFWFAGLFLLALLGVLGLTARCWAAQFRREQQERDFARSDWINGHLP